MTFVKGHRNTHDVTAAGRKGKAASPWRQGNVFTPNAARQRARHHKETIMDHLTVVFCRTRDEKPLITITGLPGGCADFTPAQLHVLADRLRDISFDAEKRPTRGHAYREQRRLYGLSLKP